MKLREVILAAIGVLLLLYGANKIVRLPFPFQQAVLDGSCHLPATVLGPSVSDQRGAAIVIHGLSANRRIMLWMGKWLSLDGLRVYLVDLPGHGDNPESFTFARAEQCTAEAIESLARRGAISPDKTVLLGHSMGGAIVVRLADRFPAAATIAISPAPMVPPKRMPSNLLVFSAQYDLSFLKQGAHELQQAAGGDREEAQDFLERRAFLLSIVPHASHTSLLLDAQVAHQTLHWVDQAVAPKGAKMLLPFQPDPADAHGGSMADAPVGTVWGLIGLLLMFPLVASGVTAALGARGAPAQAARPPLLHVLVRWVIAALFAVCVLNYFVPLWWLHLYTGSYLASLLLIVAIVVWVLDRGSMQSLFACSPRAGIAAVFLGLVTMLALGAWLNWQLTDAWLNAPRWWRFALLFPLLIPYQFVEEAALGAPPEIRQRAQRAARFGRFLLLRLVLWLACLFGLYLFNSDQVLIVLMTLYFAGFSVMQRCGADGVRRRTGSAAAAAAFGAILAAWFIAAVFPLT